MKRQNIDQALKRDPVTVFAVQLPRSRYDKTPVIVPRVLRRVDNEFHPDGFPDEGPLALRNIIDTWSSYDYARSYDEAHTMDRQRTERLRRNAERAARKARVEAFLPAFSGLMIEGPQGTQAPLDGQLKRIMLDMESQTYTAATDVWEAIAGRIASLERLVTASGGAWGGAWGGEAADTGRPEVTVLPPRPTKSIEEVESELALLAGELR